MLQIDGVCVSYLRKLVLAGLSLEARQGEIVALIGPNGSGKSTVLRTIIGLLHPSKGDIWLRGERITRLSPHEVNARGLGYLLQDKNVFPSLTVAENLELARSANRGSAGTTGTAFETFPRLKELASRRAGLLSGGERQMLAISMVLVQRPCIVLLDEPSAGLAPVLVQEILGRLREYNEKQGVAILLVEQNVRLAVRMAHRVYRLSNGKSDELDRNRFNEDDLLTILGVRPAASVAATAAADSGQ